MDMPLIIQENAAPGWECAGTEHVITGPVPLADQPVFEGDGDGLAPVADVQLL
jgi:hypothetical protein